MSYIAFCQTWPAPPGHSWSSCSQHHVADTFIHLPAWHHRLTKGISGTQWHISVDRLQQGLIAYNCVQWFHFPFTVTQHFTNRAGYQSCYVSGACSLFYRLGNRDNTHQVSCRFPQILLTLSWFLRFKTRSQNCGKRLLASSCLSVCPPAWNNSAPTGRIFVKFDIWEFFENLSRKFKFH
jgi:hypothetical protein